MARNRKNESAAARFSPALKALLLFVFFVTSGVGYVWYKNQIGILGQEITKLELTLKNLERDNKIRRDRLAALSSPVELDARVKKMNLGLGPPALSQVVRITETPTGPQSFSGPDRSAVPVRAEATGADK